MPDIKRLNYFSGEFLIDRDFNEEQAYHRDLRRRHNLHLHTWGVANGLEVKQTGEKSLEIDPGMAIDKDGRELVLLGSETLPASGPANGTLYVRIEYGERLSDDPADQESASGAAGAPKQSKRWVERPTCRATEAKPADDGAVILLATVQLDDSGKIKAVDASIRTVAGSRIDPAADLRVRSLTADSAYLDCVQLGAFTDGDADEWPKVFWHRNLSGNWDEGLIKHSSARGVFKKAGFGVHMHKDREFGMWSTGWDPLFSVDGGSGNTYVKGSLSIGGGHDLVFRAGAGTPEDPNSPDDPGDIVFQAHDGTQKARIWSEPGSAKGLHLSGSDNTAKLTIDAGGNVGVGTTEPKAKLHVCAGGGFGNIKLFSPSSPLADFGYDGGTDNTFFFSHGGDQSGETRFRWDPSDRTLLLLKNTGDVSIPSGNVGIGTTQPKAKLDIDGSALLGSEVGLNAADMPRHLGAPLKSGFYQNDGVELPGDVPDTSHGWTHLIAARHSNQDNNHQLQIAASYSQNDRIFFRKLQTGSLTPVENAPWYEFATRDANEFQGMQVFKSELNVFGETSFLNNALRVDRSWLPSPVFSGVTYTTRVTLQCPTNDNSSIAFHSPGGSRTALVADGPIISTESGAYFAGDVGIGTLAPGAKLEVKGNIVFDSVLATPGRMHLDGGELLYLLNKSGVIVGKEWSGNGNLTVSSAKRGAVAAILQSRAHSALSGGSESGQQIHKPLCMSMAGIRLESLSAAADIPVLHGTYFIMRLMRQVIMA